MKQQQYGQVDRQQDEDAAHLGIGREPSHELHRCPLGAGGGRRAYTDRLRGPAHPRPQPRERLELRPVRQHKAPALPPDNALALPVLQHLGHALAGRADQPRQRLLRQLQIDFDAFGGGHAVAGGQHQQPIGESLRQRLRRVRLDRVEQDAQPLRLQRPQRAAQGRVPCEQGLQVGRPHLQQLGGLARVGVAHARTAVQRGYLADPAARAIEVQHGLSPITVDAAGSRSARCRHRTGCAHAGTGRRTRV